MPRRMLSPAEEVYEAPYAAAYHFLHDSGLVDIGGDSPRLKLTWCLHADEMAHMASCRALAKLHPYAAVGWPED